MYDRTKPIIIQKRRVKTEADLLSGERGGCTWSWRPKERGNSLQKVPNSSNKSRAGPKIQTVTARAGCDDDGPSNLSPSLQPLNSSISLYLSLISAVCCDCELSIFP